MGPDQSQGESTQAQHQLRSAEIFLDPLAISILDQEHSDEEIRWVTIGMDNRGGLVVLIHTFSDVSPEECKIRVISARKADGRETNQYYEESVR